MMGSRQEIGCVEVETVKGEYSDSIMKEFLDNRVHVHDIVDNCFIFFKQRLSSHNM